MKQRNVAKFQVQDILPIAFSITVAGIGIAYGINVLADTKDDLGEDACAARDDVFTTYDAAQDLCTNSSGGAQTAVPTQAYFNATTDGITAVAKFPAKLGLIVTVVIAAILIGILVRYLMVR